MFFRTSRIFASYFNRLANNTHNMIYTGNDS